MIDFPVDQVTNCFSSKADTECLSTEGETKGETEVKWNVSVCVKPVHPWEQLGSHPCWAFTGMYLDPVDLKTKCIYPLICNVDGMKAVKSVSKVEQNKAEGASGRKQTWMWACRAGLDLQAAEFLLERQTHILTAGKDYTYICPGKKKYLDESKQFEFNLNNQKDWTCHTAISNCNSVFSDVQFPQSAVYWEHLQ